jgi:hypothetical protein
VTERVLYPEFRTIDWQIKHPVSFMLRDDQRGVSSDSDEAVDNERHLKYAMRR